MFPPVLFDDANAMHRRRGPPFVTFVTYGVQWEQTTEADNRRKTKKWTFRTGTRQWS